MQQIFVDVIVQSYQTDREAYKALNERKLLAIGGVVRKRSADPEYRVIDTGRIMPRSGVFRRELPVSLKVPDLSVLPPWQTGNEDLALTYEAAVNAMLQQNTFAHILARYNVSNTPYSDCFTSSSAYRVPDTPSGALLEVVRNQVVRIGTVYGEYLPLWHYNATVPGAGAVLEIEKKLVDWMSKLLGKDIVLSYVPYATHKAVAEALVNGKVDMTTQFFFLGGFIDGIPTRTKFRQTCTTIAISMHIVVRADSNVTSIEELRQHVEDTAHALEPDKYGAVTQNAEAMLRQLLGDVADIVLYNSEREAIEAVVNGSVFAAMPMQVGSLNSAHLLAFPAHRLMPLCAFFRKDRTKACGDMIIDKMFDEQCEFTGTGCLSNCSCSVGYMPQTPAALSCTESQRVKDNKTIIAVSVSTSALALLLIVGAGVFVGMYRRKAQRYQPLAEPLSQSLQEFDPGDISLGIRVQPASVQFGASSMQLPLDQDFEDRVVISGVSREPTTFTLEFPNIPTYKC
jgi:hypothetical protein